MHIHKYQPYIQIKFGQSGVWQVCIEFKNLKIINSVIINNLFHTTAFPKLTQAHSQVQIKTKKLEFTMRCRPTN